MNRIYKSRRRGQGMTEYILIVALIAIGTIGIVTTFGNNIRGIFNASTNALAGQTNQATGNQPSAVNRVKTVQNFGQGQASQ